MAYSEHVLRRAQARLAQEKADCEAESAARIEHIYRQHPRLREIDRAMRQSVAKAVSVAFRKGVDTVAAIDAIKLLESGLSDLCHCTLAVTAPEELEQVLSRETDFAETDRRVARLRQEGMAYLTASLEQE